LATGLPVALGPATGRPDGDGEPDPGTDDDEPEDPGSGARTTGPPLKPELRPATIVMTPAPAATKSTTPIGSSVHANRRPRREWRAGGVSGIVGPGW
jgi:hypothetical protein